MASESTAEAGDVRRLLPASLARPPTDEVIRTLEWLANATSAEIMDAGDLSRGDARIVREHARSILTIGAIVARRRAAQ